MALLRHVENGVIVVDTQVNLEEATPVRIETLVRDEKLQRANPYRLVLQCFDEWNKEDAADTGRLGDPRL